MDFLLVGSVNNYVKNLGLQHKWKIKKEKGDFINDESLTEIQRNNERFKASYMQQMEIEEQNTDEALTNIHSKIQMGTKLTPDEMKYLKAKDPMTYQKVKNLENEKKQYERDLKNCKTKEEVQKLKMTKVSSSLSAIGAVKNNPDIPESTKIAVAVQETRRMNELEKILNKFVNSKEYKDIPTEAELHKAESDIKKAEIAEKQQNTDETDKTDETENNKFNDTSDNNTENVEVKNADNTIADNVPDKTQAENSPEAQKVKRTKAKAAYKKSTLVETEQPSVLLKG